VVGGVVTVVAKPTLETKIVPAVLQALSRGEVMILFPSDPTEASQRFTVYRFPFGEGVHGIFVSATAAKNGSFQTFHLNGQRRNGLFYFTFVPSDTNENGGGAFMGRKNEAKPDDQDYVGVLYGVDKWKNDTACTLHRFDAVIGPVEDVPTFQDLIAARRKDFAASDEPARGHAGLVLAPCLQKASLD
jgi:hypothetical protein